MVSDAPFDAPAESAAQRSQRRAPRTLLDIEHESVSSAAPDVCKVTFPQMIELLSDVSPTIARRNPIAAGRYRTGRIVAPILRA